MSVLMQCRRVADMIDARGGAGNRLQQQDSCRGLSGGTAGVEGNARVERQAPPTQRRSRATLAPKPIIEHPPTRLRNCAMPAGMPCRNSVAAKLRPAYHAAAAATAPGIDQSDSAPSVAP